MNILYINHYAGNPEYGMEFRPYYLAQEWHKTGNKSLILAASFSHLRRKNPDKTGFEQKDNAQYYWIKTPQYKGNGIGRVRNIFAFAGRIFTQKKQILKHIKPDVVVASSTHPFDIFPALFLAKITKAKLVFEIHDLWPLSIIELGNMSKYHPFVLLVGLAEWFAYKLSDKVVSILPSTYEHVKKFGVRPENFSVIPNGIVIADWEDKIELPNSHKQAIEELKKQGKFLVCYTGAHGVANALTYLLDAAKLLEGKNIHFILVGDGQEKENLQTHAKEQRINNVTFLDPIDKKAIPKALSYMDALYIGLQNQPLFRFGISPNKIFDYMMARKPIISSITAGNNPVKDANCGISIAGEEVQPIANAILDISKKSSQELDILGSNGKKHVIEKHDYKALAQDFLKAVS